MAFGQIKDLYKLQKEARKMQKQMKKMKIEGESKKGEVKLTVNGAQEIQDIENRIGETALVASSVLVSGFSQFMCQLKIYGTMYPRSMSKKQVEHFVSFFNENPNYLSFSKVKNQEPITKENFELLFISLDNLVQLIREDLSVVEGDVQEILERFVDLPIDKFKLMRNPNIVD